ncbi:MAG: ABC transporter ATP-binding protein [Ruminiclostridium sp.]|nr:ABC transporter ATP-binding protein [Ruminiclostridium sp.]
MTGMPFKSNIQFLFKYLNTQKLKLTILAVFLLSRIALQIYNPQYIKRFIDSASTGATLQHLLSLGLMFLAITCLEQLVIVVMKYLSNKITWDTTNALRLDLTKHCLNLDMSFHNNHTSGELVQRIDGDVEKLNNFFSTFILQVIGSSILVLGILIVIATIDIRVGLLTALFVVISIIILLKMRNYGIATVREYQAETADLIGFMDERISGREDIKSCGAEPYIFLRFYERIKALFKTRKKTGFKIGTVTNIGSIVIGVITAVVIGACGYVYLLDRKMSIGTIYLIYYYTTILLIPLKNIVYQLGDMQNINAALYRINELFSQQSKVKDCGKNRIVSSELELTFKYVTFGYNNGNDVLKGVDFHLPPKKSVGILGKTGSGKTTIARLIYRLYDCEEGAILLNGINIKDVELSSLRHNIGIVTQNVEIFHGTLRDNITLFNDNILDSEISMVFGELGMDEWLKSLPNGLGTEIYKDGKNLSAGEAQLIAFARVFLKNPQLVILDEATSRLDPSTESIIEKAIDSLIKNKTAIIIAHRLSTVKKADLIMIMDNGSIVEFGDSKSLENDINSKYKILLKEVSL